MISLPRIGNELSWPTCSLGGTRRLHMPSGSRMGWAGAALPARAVAMEKPLSLSCVYQSPLPPRPQAASLQPAGASSSHRRDRDGSCRQRQQAQASRAVGTGIWEEGLEPVMDVCPWTVRAPRTVSLTGALSPQPAEVSGPSTGHSRATERPEVNNAEPLCFLSLLRQAQLARGFFVAGHPRQRRVFCSISGLSL